MKRPSVLPLPRLAFAACDRRGPAIPAPPRAGGPARSELSSEPVALWTDAGAPRGREREVAACDGAAVGAFVPPQLIAHAWGTRSSVRMPEPA